MKDEIRFPKQRAPRRTLECRECLRCTFDTWKRPLLCAHCGAVILESITEKENHHAAT